MNAIAADPLALIAYAQRVGYLELIGEQWSLTGIGGLILASPDRLRAAVIDITLRFQPPWIALSIQGRQAVSQYRVASSLLICLREANLLEATDYEAVAFWDEISGLARTRRDQRLLGIGREGERLTIALERRRTGREPVWRSIAINGLGYDVESIRSAEDPRPFYLEVKASAMPLSEAVFHLSRNEWRFLSMHCEDAAIDLWTVGEAYPGRNHRVLPAQIAPHMPENHGIGHWEMCTISYAAVIYS